MKTWLVTEAGSVMMKVAGVEDSGRLVMPCLCFAAAAVAAAAAVVTVVVTELY